jgi:hypothetical protein
MIQKPDCHADPAGRLAMTIVVNSVVVRFERVKDGQVKDFSPSLYLSLGH